MSTIALKDVAGASRPHYWSKNVLLLLPLLASHRIFERTSLEKSLIGIAAFCLCASGVYLFNDVIDQPRDRVHPHKQLRAVAAGRLDSVVALTWSAVAILASLSIGYFLGTGFDGLLVLYVASAAAYSLALKRVPVVDVIALAGLCVLRVFAGGVATDVRPSSWLIAFSLFLFLSLAFLKRSGEIEHGSREIAGKAYVSSDRALIWMMGLACAALSAVVLVSYSRSSAASTLYAAPARLWVLAAVELAWFARLWKAAAGNRLGPDLVIEVLSDWATYVAFLAAMAVLWVAK